MSKTIKLEEQVYSKLEEFRDKRETFSEAVERLLELPQGIFNLVNVLEGSIAFSEKQRDQLKKTVSTH